MTQAWSIFVKDSRQLRYPVAAVLAWMALLSLVTMGGPSGNLPEWTTGGIGGASDGGSGDAFLLARSTIQGLSIVLPIGWWLILARAVHADGLVGDRQHWLTRPYSRSSLLAGKVLFGVVYAVVPVVVMHSAIAISRGFPVGLSMSGGLWTGLLVLLGIVLPAIALASVTSTFAQVLFASVGLYVVLRVAASAWPALNSGIDGGYSRLRFEWIPDTLAIGVAIAASAAVIGLQFRWRRAGRARALSLIGIAGVAAALGALPWRTIFLVQSWTDRSSGVGQLSASVLAPAPVDTSFRRQLGLGVGAPPSPAALPTQITLSVRIDGLPQDSGILCEAAAMQFDGTSSWRRSINSVGGPGNFRHANGDRGCTLSFATFPFRRANQLDLTVRGTLFVTVFGQTQQSIVPVDDGTTYVPGFGVCAAIAHEVRTTIGTQTEVTPATWVDCQNAFRGPGVALAFGGRGAGPGYASEQPLSYSPFPASFGIVPLGHFARDLPAMRTVPILIRHPIAHIAIPLAPTPVTLRQLE
jgi:hypothetical protein